jgi:hypothetical protein
MPFIQLALVIIIKRLVIGRFTPMNAEEKAQPWNQFRYWLMLKVRTDTLHNLVQTMVHRAHKYSYSGSVVVAAYPGIVSYLLYGVSCLVSGVFYQLMSGSHLCGVAQLVGTHYEVISIIFRLLGSKVCAVILPLTVALAACI